jgi:hypothetical protein
VCYSDVCPSCAQEAAAASLRPAPSSPTRMAGFDPAGGPASRAQLEHASESPPSPRGWRSPSRWVAALAKDAGAIEIATLRPKRTAASMASRPHPCKFTANLQIYCVNSQQIYRFTANRQRSGHSAPLGTQGPGLEPGLFRTAWCMPSSCFEFLQRGNVDPDPAHTVTGRAGHRTAPRAQAPPCPPLGRLPCLGFAPGLSHPAGLPGFPAGRGFLWLVSCFCTHRRASSYLP